jgi:hypothetical protein
MRYKPLFVAGVLTLLMSLALAPAQAATQTEIEDAIADGIAWLVARQNTTAGHTDYGSWNAYFGQREAGTGLALYALCKNAHELGDEHPEIESPFDPDFEYHQNVIDGFNWAFARLSVVGIGVQDHTTGATGTLDDPDSNGNGYGVCAQSGLYFETYSTAILVAAIAASGTPDRLVDVAGSPVDGWTYGDVAQDMADFLAFGQVEYPVPDISTEGGWAHNAVDNGIGGFGSQGDQSITGYAVLGLSEAEDFGCALPDWVKAELNAWIDLVQDDVDGDTNDGGSWYSHPGDAVGVNVLKTGNLILEMAFVGDTPDVPRVVDATDYLVRHWNDPGAMDSLPGWNGNPAHYEAMFCAKNGLVSMGIWTLNGIDWFADFADAIVAQQYKAATPAFGSWQSSSGRGEPVIITEWAVLTLDEVVPQAPEPPQPPDVEVALDIKPTSCLNPLSVGAKGVLPVAILGTEDFDVSHVDPASVRLEGIAPLRWGTEDVAAPFDCTSDGPDGYPDLTLKFDTREIAGALGNVQDGDVLELQLTGTLLEEVAGTGIVGEDIVVILKKGKK